MEKLFVTIREKGGCDMQGNEFKSLQCRTEVLVDPRCAQVERETARAKFPSFSRPMKERSVRVLPFLNRVEGHPEGSIPA